MVKFILRNILNLALYIVISESEEDYGPDMYIGSFFTSCIKKSGNKKILLGCYNR